MVELCNIYPLICLIILSFSITSIATFQFNIPEDATSNFTELGHKYGQIVIEHDVITEDGYILKLFNIPGNKTKPILLTHGVLDTGDTFILRGNTSLAVTLANAGYDVWVATTRGSTYSRRHITLNPDQDMLFWDFSFHEIGYYDLPALIDYVLTKTGVEKLSAIGHSLGNMIFYVLGSTRAEYNSKVNIVIALGPVCYFNHIQSIINVVIDLGIQVNDVFQLLQTEEIFAEDSGIKKLWNKICTLDEVGYDVCANSFFSIAGYDVEEFEREIYYTVIGHYPKNISRKMFLHLVQSARRSSFGQFDYGIQRNLEFYDSPQPTNYNLSKVSMNVALFVGRNDGLTPLEDVRRLGRELPSVVEFRIMERKAFNHIDHIWGRNMKDYLFPHIFNLLSKYS